MINDPLLTVAYIRTKDTTQEQINHFLSFFEDSQVVVTEHWAIPGDRQTTVMNIFTATKTPYVTIVDPNGWVDVEKMLEVVSILQSREQLAFAVPRVCLIKSTGEQHVSRPSASLSPADIYISANRLAPITIYRLSMVNEIIEQFYRKFFGHFEWVLRMVLANKYRFKALDEVVYYYGDGARSSVISEGERFIKPGKSVEVLLKDGLITLNAYQGLAIGIKINPVEQ